MRKIIFVAFVGVSLIAKSQIAHDYLDINNVKARINADGSLFSDYSVFSPGQFEVPKGSGKGTIFAGNLWIGGIDVGGQLKLAAQTYKQSGTDFWPGPLDTTYATIMHVNSLAWNKVWKINKSTIDSFRLGLLNPIPQNLLNWPGNGDPSMGQAQNLAPYVDVNGDNIYNPTVGDFPCIKGDQCVYFIFNDSELGSLHGTGGLRFGIELHGMAYAFNNLADTSLNNTVFINYRLINRSTFQYDSLCIGNFTDFSLGCYSDDMFGSDVERSAYYAYNGDNDDDTACTGGGYGKFPPAQAVVFLKGPEADVNDGKDNDHNCTVDEPQEEWTMSNSLFYRNINGVPYGTPQVPLHYYNYLRSIWGDGLHLKYDGMYGYSTAGPDCNYIFPGNPSSDNHDWGIGGNCSTTPSLPDWDGLFQFPPHFNTVGSYGGITLKPGQEVCFDFAYVWARTNDTVTDMVSVRALGNSIDTVQSLFLAKNLNNCGCEITPLGINDHEQANNPIHIFPNPSSDFIFITYESKSRHPKFEILDMMGRTISTFKEAQTKIDISGLPQGIYLLKITDGGLHFAKRFIRQ